jgi:hypothetical protein
MKRLFRFLSLLLVGCDARHAWRQAQLLVQR